MEEAVLNLSENQIVELLYANNIRNSDKLKELSKKLQPLRLNSLDNNLKEKYLKCQKLAQEKFQNLEKEIDSSLSKAPEVNIYMDGVFDIIHSGHFNAFRQAKRLGDVIVAGVNSDEDVKKAKGKTLMDINERVCLASACKWVSKSYKDTPYTPTLETLKTYHCDYIAHGDDIPTNENGQTIYDDFIKEKKLRVFKRTEGISTTDIIGRLLLSLKDRVDKLEEKPENAKLKKGFEELSKLTNLKHDSMSSILTTSYRICEFSNQKLPKPNDKIVYIAGCFDVLHKGIIEALEKAKSLGDFVYVGVYDDATCAKINGKYFPILCQNERILNLLSLKYVDDVVFSAKEKITEDFIKLLKINVVVRCVTPKVKKNGGDEEIFEVAKKLGICKDVEISCDLDDEVLTERMWENKEEYITKYIKKITKKEIRLETDCQQLNEEA